MRRILALLLAASFVVTGCGDDDDPVAVDPPAADSQEGAADGNGGDDEGDDGDGSSGAAARTLRSLEQDLCTVVSDEEVATATGLDISESGYPGPNECVWGTGDVADHSVTVRVVPMESFEDHVARAGENPNMTVEEADVAGEAAVLVTTSGYGSVLVGPEGADGPALEIRAGDVDQATAVAEVALPAVRELLGS